MARSEWPVVEGEYVVGDRRAALAACVLTSTELMQPLAELPGVAIAGTLHTANLGIERVVTNVTANPNIRFLLLCGKESRLFKPGQSLLALHAQGVDRSGTIVGAEGYQPVLRGTDAALVERFRSQVTVLDHIGAAAADLAASVAAAASTQPRPFRGGRASARSGKAAFKSIRPGGTRDPLVYDPKGFFVISIDRAAEQIVVRHYSTDHRPQHEMRGRNPGSLLLGLIRESLVTQLSHAGYLGGELTKAQYALKAELPYEQDRPLRVPVQRAAPAPPRKTDLAAAAPGDEVDIVLRVAAAPSGGRLEGLLLKRDPAFPDRPLERTDTPASATWDSATKIAMGGPADLKPEAVLRISGTVQHDGSVAASSMAVLTSVARVA